MNQIKLDFSQIRILPKEKTQPGGPQIAFRITDREAKILDMITESMGLNSKNEYAHECLIKCFTADLGTLSLLDMHQDKKIHELLGQG